MKKGRVIGSIGLIFFLTLGCAMGQAARAASEGVSVQRGSPENPDRLIKEIKEIKDLEETITRLRSELRELENRFKNIQTRPFISTHRLPQEVFLCGEKFQQEDRNIWENLDREFLLALGNEVQVLLWMKRAKRYFPYIEKRLKEMNLPDDLKYVTITESSLRPQAISSVGAAGIWQFIPSTGEKHGMRRSKAIDERYDFFKATEGALNYLKNLHDEFQSWTLAMAAYNSGENRVRREIELQKTRNYFYLELPLETKRYVYKIAVAKIILSDPGKYGFVLEERDYYEPVQLERIQVELKQSLPIIEVARATGSYYKEIKELNLHFSEDVIPTGTQFINLPPGTSERFLRFFSTWRSETEKK